VYFETDGGGPCLHVCAQAVKGPREKIDAWLVRHHGLGAEAKKAVEQLAEDLF
jgi:hypothetical protein